eukprot:49302-Alexandrium_andersonii.AAC.1
MDGLRGHGLEELPIAGNRRGPRPIKVGPACRAAFGAVISQQPEQQQQRRGHVSSTASSTTKTSALQGKSQVSTVAHALATSFRAC